MKDEKEQISEEFARDLLYPIQHGLCLQNGIHDVLKLWKQKGYIKQSREEEPCGDWIPNDMQNSEVREEKKETSKFTTINNIELSVVKHSDFLLDIARGYLQDLYNRVLVSDSLRSYLYELSNKFEIVIKQLDKEQEEKVNEQKELYENKIETLECEIRNLKYLKDYYKNIR